MKKKKGLIFFLVLCLLISGAIGVCTCIFWSKTSRNETISLIKPSISKSENCVYSDEDIEKAVEAIKENFKNIETPVKLLSISFSEKDNDWFWNTDYHLKDDYSERNRIYLQCDYYVLKDEAAWSKGLYKNYGQIMVRENESSPWKIVDGGYA